MGLLSIALVYILITRPVQILFSILRFMKGNDRIGLLFLPIWGPAYLLDKQFKFGIYEHEKSDPQDLRYNTEKQVSIKTENFQKLIIARPLTIEDFTESLFQFLDIETDLDSNDFYFDQRNSQMILILPDKLELIHYFFLIQWIDNYIEIGNQKDVFGLAYSKSDPETSFFAINDPTGNHINSMIGKTSIGETFHYYLLQEKFGTHLNTNSQIEIPTDKDLNQLVEEFNITKLNKRKIKTLQTT